MIILNRYLKSILADFNKEEFQKPFNAKTLHMSTKIFQSRRNNRVNFEYSIFGFPLEVLLGNIEVIILNIT